MLRKMSFYAFLILNLISSLSHADDSVFLTKSSPAPFDGFLLPKEKVQELQNATIERDTYQKLNDSLKTSLALEQTNSGLKDNKITLLLNQNDTLAKAAYTERTLNNWEKVGYFAAGIILTGLAIKGAHDLYH